MEHRIIFMDCTPLVADVGQGNYQIVKSWADDGTMGVLRSTLAWKQLAEYFNDDTPRTIAVPNGEPTEYQTETAEVRNWEETPESPVLLYKNRYIVGFNSDACHSTILDTTIQDDQWRTFIKKSEERPSDLITQAQAAKIAGITTQAVRNAITAGRLRGYRNPNAKYQRQAATLVSEYQVRGLWS